MKLEPALYELRPFLLIAIAMFGLSQVGWNAGTICAGILIAAAILIIHWRLKSRQKPPPTGRR
ncbi:MAG: hypothetical protein AAB250_13100 [Bdellovibrionota bacterium]